jgi:hypothetical protein
LVGFPPGGDNSRGAQAHACTANQVELLRHERKEDQVLSGFGRR